MQRDSAIFTASEKLDQKYDAYEKDIAVVSFYFNHQTVFEYTRYIEHEILILKCLVFQTCFQGEEDDPTCFYISSKLHSIW